jgi:hypothetical protein
MLFLLEKV